MSGTPTKYGILTAVDGSAESRAAVSWAASEAALRNESVTLMHVIQPVVSWPIGVENGAIAEWQEDTARDAIAQARNDLTAVMNQSRPLEVRTEVLYANAVHALVEASKDAQMIVVGSHGKGALGRLLLGSVSSGVVHHAHCPVVVVHTDEDSPVDLTAPILLGIDGSRASEAATAWAFDEASRRAVPLVALHAWSDVGVFPILGMNWRTYREKGEELLGERLAGWQEQYPDVPVERRLVCDTPARWLLEQSEHCQLVVLGSHGRGGFGGMLLGSVSSALAQSAKVPVVVVRTQ